MFTAYPAYDPYRALGLTDPRMEGEDVFALQNGINAVLRGGDRDVQRDGILGETTKAAIRLVQKQLKVGLDGVAGGVTQRAIAMQILQWQLNTIVVPVEIVVGQLQKESSFLLGNYGPKRDPDPQAAGGWSYDAGVAQLNSAHNPPVLGFTPQYAIWFQVSHMRERYDKYSNRSLFQGGDHTDRRRWALAAGSWNAPAFTDTLAGVGNTFVSVANRELIETYMREVMVGYPG